MCHLYSDGSHMLQRDRSQRENKKLSEKARSLDASPTPGSKRQRKCLQLCSDTLLLQRLLWVLILRTYCNPAVPWEGSRRGRERSSFPSGASSLPYCRGGHFEDWWQSTGPTEE